MKKTIIIIAALVPIRRGGNLGNAIFYLIIAIILLSASKIYAQSITSESYTHSKETSNKNYTTIYLKANYVNAFSEKNSQKVYGLAAEVQFKAGDKTSYLFSFNPLYTAEDGGKISNVASIITAGVKFYVEKDKSKFRGYFSLSGGFIIDQYAMFTVAPALGFEYNFYKELGINIEAKPLLTLNPLISISSGISLNFK